MIQTYKGFNHFTLGYNWCAKCVECGQVLLKYAFTEEEAQREAEGHRCR